MTKALTREPKEARSDKLGDQMTEEYKRRHFERWFW